MNRWTAVFTFFKFQRKNWFCFDLSQLFWEAICFLCLVCEFLGEFEITSIKWSMKAKGTFFIHSFWCGWDKYIAFLQKKSSLYIEFAFLWVILMNNDGCNRFSLGDRTKLSFDFVTLNFFDPIRAFSVCCFCFLIHDDYRC